MSCQLPLIALVSTRLAPRYQTPFGRARGFQGCKLVRR